MRNEIYEGIIDLVDRIYDCVLFDNDTKKLEIEWGDNGGFVITLYYMDKEEEWVEQECYDSDYYFENFSELFLGECNVIESMTNDIVNCIN